MINNSTEAEYSKSLFWNEKIDEILRKSLYKIGLFKEKTLIREKQYIPVENGELILNLGSGNKIYSNCINLDIKYAPGLDIRADALHLPFKDNTFAGCIACDLIEHFSLIEGNRLLEPVFDSNRHILSEKTS